MDGRYYEHRDRAAFADLFNVEDYDKIVALAHLAAWKRSRPTRTPAPLADPKGNSDVQTKPTTGRNPHHDNHT